MIGRLEAVAEYDGSENALGYTVYYYLTNMENDKLSTSKILAVNGVKPTNDTIASANTPLSTTYCRYPQESARGRPRPRCRQSDNLRAGQGACEEGKLCSKIK